MGLLRMVGRTDEPGFFSSARLNVMDPVEWQPVDFDVEEIARSFPAINSYMDIGLA